MANVAEVRFVFTRASVPPGLRTVGVFKTPGTASTGLGLFAAIVSRLGAP